MDEDGFVEDLVEEFVEVLEDGEVVEECEDEDTFDESEFLADMREKFDRAYDADSDDREEAYADLVFLDGDQWNHQVKKDRETENRPCLTINKLPELVDQVTGQQRKADLTIKVKPVDDKGDPDTAKTINGLLMNIAHNSNSDVAYNAAFDSAVQCGRGFFRVLTEFSDDDVFEQDIIIDAIKERFSVTWDPAAKKHDLSDAKFIFVEEMMQRKDYEVAYPDVAVTDFDSSSSSGEGWETDDEVRVVEFFWKEPEVKEIFLLADGRVVDELMEGDVVTRSRTVNGHTVMWCKASGSDILEGPQVFPGKYIPIIPVWGKEITINNRRKTRGLIRYAKDAQMAYNYFRTTGVEHSALQPKVPYLVTATHLGPYKKVWDNAIKKNLPYLPYVPDEKAPYGPKREAPPTSPTGFTQEAMLADSEIRSTVGLHQPSTGESSNAKSGRAIGLLQAKGDTGTFVFMDNLQLALSHAGKIIVGLIPHIYDTERIIRITNPDGTSNSVLVNGDDGPQNNLTTGKYDVYTDSGPNYLTQRQESLDFWLNFIRQVPSKAGLISDIIVRNSDMKDSAEAEERLRKTLPPGMVEPREGEKLPAPPQPDPMAEFEQKKTVVELAQEEEKLKKMQHETEVERLKIEEQRLRNVDLLDKSGLGGSNPGGVA